MLVTKVTCVQVSPLGGQPWLVENMQVAKFSAQNVEGTLKEYNEGQFFYLCVLMKQHHKRMVNIQDDGLLCNDFDFMRTVEKIRSLVIQMQKAERLVYSFFTHIFSWRCFPSRLKSFLFRQVLETKLRFVNSSSVTYTAVEVTVDKMFKRERECVRGCTLVSSTRIVLIKGD